MHFPTLTAALDARAQHAGSVTLIDGESEERRLSFAGLRERALQRLTAMRHQGLDAGDRLVLFIDDSRAFLESFWAALYGGIIPVPLAAGASDAHLEKLLQVWRHLEQPAVICDPRKWLARLEERLGGAERERLSARALSCDRPPDLAAASPDQRASGDTAFVQFSSGSTGEPKGVVLTHANIVTNIAAASSASQYQADEVALSWMPLTHDMGLIGFHLTMLANGFDHHIMRSDLFARRPLLWLHKAAEKRATLLCSPNFGYRHTLRALGNKGLPEIDLSGVRLIYNGAEPIAPALAREFLERLAPTGLRRETMFCVYGLAEASLAVAFPPPRSGMHTVTVDRTWLGIGDRPVEREAAHPEAIELVRLGRAIPECRLRIAAADGAVLEDGRVGHVQIAGGNVTSGYLDAAAANAETFTADGWLDTGDVGFILDGELVITGRAKEVIFVNGQNYYPQDVEAALVAGVQALDLNKVAVAGMRHPRAESDELAVFVQFRGKMADFGPLAREVTRMLNHHTGLAVTRVVPVPRIPKTTSGKLQRGQLAAGYLEGEFDAALAELQALLGEPSVPQPEDDDAANEIAIRLKRICDSVLAEKRIGYDDDLFELELSSLDLAQLHECIEAEFPDRLEITELLDHPTINRLAAFLERTP